MSTTAQRAQTASMVGIWVFVLSDAVGFAALLTTMASLRVGTAGFSGSASPGLGAGLGATALLATISGSLLAARFRPERGKLFARVGSLAAFAFCALQYWEYHAVLGPELTLATPAQESFVVVTGYHLMHVFAGGLALLWGLTRPSLPLGPLSVYWHFVDGLWLFIFGAFYLL
jgi:heme/copper-type cytochrome/quinol oxidase subunit 3